MWTLALQLVFMGVYMQVPMYPSCMFAGLLAYCAIQRYHSVPDLPPYITHLYLELNYISEINSTSLRGLKELQELDLGNQRVQLVIRNNAFLRQNKLTRLVLGNNHGLQLEPRSFAGLFRLQHLDLYYCSLNNSFLTESFLQPLLSLETLNLDFNRINRLQPGRFFTRLKKFTSLNLKLNPIDRLCEEDLVGFSGKDFALLNMSSNYLSRMFSGHLDLDKCGNPFRGMTFKILDLSSNGFNVNNLRQFLKLINGTRIAHIILPGSLGRDFSHNNLPDPDRNTFQGLMNSAVEHLDLSSNRIFALQTAVFSPLKNVVIIDISQNKINEINRNSFDGLQGHLRMLNLSHNLLGEIYSHTFANLTDLRVLDLNYNHIGVFGRGAFTGLPRLGALFLTGNSLRQLDFPASLPNLDILSLADNKLKSVDNITHLGKNSIYVDVMDNRLTDLEDVYVILNNFKRVQSLYFGSNFIKYCSISNVPVPVNNSLEVLDLHDCSLQMLWVQGDCLGLFHHLKNLLGLDLSFNSLTTLPQGVFRGLSSIREIDLSSNALTYLQRDIFPASLRRLDLSRNFLASPDPAVFQSLLFLNLTGNRFLCDCNLEIFLAWLNATDQQHLSVVREYRCEFPAALHNLRLLNYSKMVEPCQRDDEHTVQGLRFALFIFSFLLVMAATLSGVVYARLRGRIFVIYKKIIGRVVEGPKATPPMEELRYDAYICFSNGDYRWVEEALLQKLDVQFSEENILRCCFEARDFLPGEDHLSNIRDAVWGSRKTVCIVSKEFLKDGWCLEAFTLAQGRTLEELTNVLIMVVVGKVAHYQLMKNETVRAFVQRREYLTWPEDPQDLDWFYEQLISRILKNTKEKRLAEDKPAADVQPQNQDAIQLGNIGEIGR